MGVGLELESVVKTNLVRISYRFTSCSFHFDGHLKQLYMSKRQSASIIEVGVVYVDVVHVLILLKAELTWAKLLQIIGNIQFM